MLWIVRENWEGVLQLQYLLSVLRLLVLSSFLHRVSNVQTGIGCAAREI